jgi:hypothetical protein
LPALGDQFEETPHARAVQMVDVLEHRENAVAPVGILQPLELGDRLHDTVRVFPEVQHDAHRPPGPACV